MFAGLSPKEKGKIYIYIYIFGFRPGRKRPCGALAGRLRPGRKPRRKEKKQFSFHFIFLLVAGDLVELLGAACT
jgi:hypothetical protein